MGMPRMGPGRWGLRPGHRSSCWPWTPCSPSSPLNPLQPSGTARTPHLLVLAVTLHNIPEGMAVGISFALASQGDTPAQLTAAVALALGIGIQNFPEGAAIALPLRQEGLSRAKSFWIGRPCPASWSPLSPCSPS